MQPLEAVGMCLKANDVFDQHTVPILSEHARHKIWVKDNGAQPFLYGSNGMPFTLPTFQSTGSTEKKLTRFR